MEQAVFDFSTILLNFCFTFILIFLLVLFPLSHFFRLCQSQFPTYLTNERQDGPVFNNIKELIALVFANAPRSSQEKIFVRPAVTRLITGRWIKSFRFSFSLFEMDVSI